MQNEKRPAATWPFPAPILVPDAFRKSVDQADFYRRGFIDARDGKQPGDLTGYPPPLRAAYSAGGMDFLARQVPA